MRDARCEALENRDLYSTITDDISIYIYTSYYTANHHNKPKWYVACRLDNGDNEKGKVYLSYLFFIKYGNIFSQGCPRGPRGQT